MSDLNGLISESSHNLDLCVGKLGSVIEKIYISQKFINSHIDTFDYAIKDKDKFLNSIKNLLGSLEEFDSVFDNIPNEGNP